MRWVQKDLDMIGPEKPPGVRNSPAKTPCFPRFSHLYSQSLLPSSLFLSCTMPPHPSLCLLSSLFPALSLSLPHLAPFSTTTSVLLCHLSPCIAPPALWCSTDNQNSAHIHTYTRKGTQVTYPHAGRHTPTTSGSPLPLSHLILCRHEKF